MLEPFGFKCCGDGRFFRMQRTVNGLGADRWREIDFLPTGKRGYFFPFSIFKDIGIHDKLIEKRSQCIGNRQRCIRLGPVDDAITNMN